MQAIRTVRQQRGYSQRELAARAGVTFRCLQQLESDKHNFRLDSIRKVINALELPEGGLDYYLEHLLTLESCSVEDISLRMMDHGFDSWKIYLFDFVDRFRSARKPSLIHPPPIPNLDPRLRALIASSVEALCDEVGIPPAPWCKAIPGCSTPWFVSGRENLKAMALIETPARFKARNIFVLDNFLSRI